MYVHAMLLQLLFSLLSYIPLAMTREKMDGTVKQTYRFFINSTLIGVLFVLVTFVLSIGISQTFLLKPSIGLWPVLFCEMVVECYKSPELSRP